MYQNELIHMVFISGGFLEVAIESWPEWDLNHDHSDLFRHSDRMSSRAMSSTYTQNQLCTATPVSSFIQFLYFISAIVFVSRR